jgi:hypothetical protein
MVFDSARGGFAYGFVRGTSMWPCLVPGDVLRAQRVPAGDLSPGDILVMTGGGGDPVVHRLSRVERCAGGEILLETSGDRSGNDEAAILAAPGEELLRTAGVLRRGVWKRPSSVPSPFSKMAPGLMVRLHCLLVRKLAWDAPSGLTSGGRKSSNSVRGKPSTRKGG